MTAQAEELLKLLGSLTATVEELTAVQKKVVASVRGDDLDQLGECMKKEQALALTLRNVDLRRAKLQQEMGLETLKLSELPDRISDEGLRQKIKAAAEKLGTEYRVMRSANEVARSALECSLHEVDNMIARMGLDPERVKEHTITMGGAHTDFRA